MLGNRDDRFSWTNLWRLGKCFDVAPWHDVYDIGQWTGCLIVGEGAHGRSYSVPRLGCSHAGNSRCYWGNDIFIRSCDGSAI